MLTEDKKITTPEYWAEIFTGKRDNAKVDASNFKRPANAFDWFQWLADQVEGPVVLDIASGHATTMKRLLAMHPDWDIICSDQTPEARDAARWEGQYHIFSAYEIPVFTRTPNTITVSQALEYMEYPGSILEYCMTQGVEFFVCTVPIGNMPTWSQLRIYTEESFREWIEQYGYVIHWDRVGDLLLCKIKINHS
jgi:hypothetical protein